MYYLLFIIYTAACCFFISKNAFVKKTGLLTNALVLLFLIKVAAGVFTGWITAHEASDYWSFNLQSMEEYRLLVSNPGEFFSGIFHSNYQTYNNYFGASQSYWNDLPTNLLLKFIAILNIFTRGNYYLNCIFFNLIGFFGAVVLYRIFIHIYPAKKPAVIVGCFLLPSMLIFTSGIHKDVLVFSATALFCYAAYFSLAQQFTGKRIVMLATCFVTILLFRSYIAVLLFPAAIAWLLARKTRLKTAGSFTVVYGIGLLLFMLVQSFAPQKSPLRFVVERQHAFFNLEVARSQISTDTLLPTTGSFIRNAPQALNHAFLRPYLFEFTSPAAQNFFAAEMLLYWCAFIAMLFLFARQKSDPFIAFSLIFIGSVFLFIGYIVPNTGAIVRYRGIFLPWLLTPLFCHIGFNRLKKEQTLK